MLQVIPGSRPGHRYGRWLDRQNTFGWINYKDIRIRAKCILAHGMEVVVPQ